MLRPDIIPYFKGPESGLNRMNGHRDVFGVYLVCFWSDVYAYATGLNGKKPLYSVRLPGHAIGYFIGYLQERIKAFPKTPGRNPRTVNFKRKRMYWREFGHGCRVQVPVRKGERQGNIPVSQNQAHWPRPRMFAESARPRLARTARLAAQRPDRDVGAHFEGVEALALRVVVDAGVLPAIA